MRMTTRLIRPGFLAVLLALFATEGAVAQDPAAAPPPADGMNEGVAVHGHWMITVVRDGQVVERREFDNATFADGERHVGLVMAGDRTPGDWVVNLNTDASEPLCGGSNVCRISEPDLTVAPPDESTGPGTLVLEGSVVAEQEGNVTRVTTTQQYCSSTTTPTDCAGTNNFITLFTGTDLVPIIPVQIGDRIDVTVAITFN